MADLELENQNPAERTTELVATPADLGPNQLMDFVGGNILEVKPGSSFAGSQHSNFGGIFARGIGRGSGVWGYGRIGVTGHSEEDAGVEGRGLNAGVRGRTEGQAATGIGVHGISDGGGTGVVGEAATGVRGTGTIGVTGTGTGGPGVSGTSDTFPGGDFLSTGGSGVRGTSTAGRGGNFASTSGPGVTGTSDTGRGGDFVSTGGSGVRGRSTTGRGGDFASTSGAGVTGTSGTGRGGEFGSTSAAQIRLSPVEGTDPVAVVGGLGGQAGDLLALVTGPSPGHGPVPPTPEVATLWFCTGRGDGITAQWVQIA
jgi:hypothetical protein